MGAKLTSQKPPQLNSADIKVDNIIYSPIPFGRVLDGKVGKFTVEVNQLEEQLISFLQEESWLTQSDEELLHSGFFKTKDHGLLENEIYMEGYFHGGQGKDSIKSLKPRDGQWMDKPAAPPRLRAFVQATAAKNQELLKEIAAIFSKGSTMRRLLDDGQAFQDIAVQVKYGESVKGGYLAWHVDTFNSVLHLAVSVKGSRTLYLQHLEGDKVAKCATELPPGSVYLSSPFAFRHAVGHEDINRESRIVAVQCRIGMTPDDYQMLIAEQGSLSLELESMSSLMQVKGFLLPSLEEVTTFLDTIEK